MLTRKFHFYLMPSDGASGDGPGGGGGGGGSSGGGGASRSRGGPPSRSKSKSKGSVSGATRGNISAKTKSKSTPTSSSKSRGGPPIGTNTAAMTPQAKVDAANAARAANPAVTTGISIDLKSKDAPDIMGPPASLANTTSGATQGNISAKVNVNGNTFGDTAVGGVLSDIGQGFRQIAIDTFGAEPDIEGYDKDGNYGFGYNSTYGQQLLAGESGIRAKGALSIDQQKAKAADYTPPDPLLKGVFDGIDLGFDVDTDSFFGKIGGKLTSFIFGKAGATLLSGFGPIGILAGTLLGSYFGNKFHDNFKDRDYTTTTYSGPKGVPHLGLNQAAYDAYIGAGGGGGKGSIDYQARLNDPNTRGGAGELPPDDSGQGGGQGGGNGGGSGSVSDGDIIVDDGKGGPKTTLEEYLDSLKRDREEAMAAVRLQERQANALQRISSRRYALGTSYRAA